MFWLRVNHIYKIKKKKGNNVQVITLMSSVSLQWLQCASIRLLFFLFRVHLFAVNRETDMTGNRGRRCWKNWPLHWRLHLSRRNKLWISLKINEKRNNMTRGRSFYEDISIMAQRLRCMFPYISFSYSSLVQNESGNFLLSSLFQIKSYFQCIALLKSVWCEISSCFMCHLGQAPF